MFEGNLAFYFLGRCIVAMLAIIATYFLAKRLPMIIDVMPLVLLAYTAINNAVILHMGLMNEEETQHHALASHFTLNIYYLYYVL